MKIIKNKFTKNFTNLFLIILPIIFKNSRIDNVPNTRIVNTKKKDEKNINTNKQNKINDVNILLLKLFEIIFLQNFS